jgi:hypothetical protein
MSFADLLHEVLRVNLLEIFFHGKVPGFPECKDH